LYILPSVRPSGFHFFEFRNSNSLLQSKAVSLASNTQPGGSGPCIYRMSPSDTMTQIYPQAFGSRSVAFCVSQGYGGGILTGFHKGSSKIILIESLITFKKQIQLHVYRILASCYILLKLNICSFVRQCNTFTS
jgi:hypothetical protein